jgi:O-antigen/teichoic acid export membrane protein
MRHKKFPLFSTWTHLLTVITVQIPSLVFGVYFSPTILGYYSLASRVGTMPITLLAQAIGQVFYPAAAKEYHQTGTVSHIVETTFKLLVQLAMFPMAVLGLFGATLFGVVFGQQWTEAGIYAQILAAWYFLSFLSVPLDIFALVNRQDLGLFFTMLNFAGRTVSLFLGVTLGLPRMTLGIFVLASVVLLSGQLFWKLRFSHLSGRWGFTIILKQLMLSLALLLPVKGVAYLSKAVWVELVGLCLATGGYILIMLLTEPSLQKFLRKGLKYGGYHG